MTLTQAVHRHEHSIETLLQDVAQLKAEVALLRSELSYLRPVPVKWPDPIWGAPPAIWPPPSWSATSDGERG
jgi:hypothetical protein